MRRKHAVSRKWVIDRIGDVARANRAPSPEAYARGATSNVRAIQGLREELTRRGSNLEPLSRSPVPSAQQLQDPAMARLYDAYQKRNLVSSARGAQAFTFDGMPVGGNTSYPEPSVLNMLVDARVRMAGPPRPVQPLSPYPSNLPTKVTPHLGDRTVSLRDKEGSAQPKTVHTFSTVGNMHRFGKNAVSAKWVMDRTAKAIANRPDVPNATDILKTMRGDRNNNDGMRAILQKLREKGVHIEGREDYAKFIPELLADPAVARLHKQLVKREIVRSGRSMQGNAGISPEVSKKVLESYDAHARLADRHPEPTLQPPPPPPPTSPKAQETHVPSSSPGSSASFTGERESHSSDHSGGHAPASSETPFYKKPLHVAGMVTALGTLGAGGYAAYRAGSSEEEGRTSRLNKHADLTGSPNGPMPTQHPGFSKKLQSYAPVQTSKKAMDAMDLTHHEAPTPPPVAAPDTHFALGNKYPITDPRQVKVASDYLDENVRLFAPVERREFALNLCKRASELGMPEILGETAKRYGGPMTTDLDQVKYAFASRQNHLVGDRGEQYQVLLDKVAEKLPYLTPHDQLQALAAFDKVAGLERLYDTWLDDPVKALTEKWAEEKSPFSEEVDGNIVLENELVFLAKSGTKELKEVFGHDLVRKLRSDPVGTFKTLPREQKVLVARAAKAVHGSGTSVPTSLLPGLVTRYTTVMHPEVAKQAAAAFLVELRNIGDEMDLDIPLVKQAERNPEFFEYISELLVGVPLTQPYLDRDNLPLCR